MNIAVVAPGGKSEFLYIRKSRAAELLRIGDSLRVRFAAPFADLLPRDQASWRQAVDAAQWYPVHQSVMDLLLPHRRHLYIPPEVEMAVWPGICFLVSAAYLSFRDGDSVHLEEMGNGDFWARRYPKDPLRHSGRVEERKLGNCSVKRQLIESIGLG